MTRFTPNADDGQRTRREFECHFTATASNRALVASKRNEDGRRAAIIPRRAILWAFRAESTHDPDDKAY